MSNRIHMTNACSRRLAKNHYHFTASQKLPKDFRELVL